MARVLTFQLRPGVPYVYRSSRTRRWLVVIRPKAGGYARMIGQGGNWSEAFRFACAYASRHRA